MADEMTHERNSRLPKVGYYLIAVALLGILFWALWREVSPQTKYQREFAHRFSAYLSKVEVRSTEAEEKIEEEKIKDDPEYQRLYATYKQLVQQEDVQAKGLKVKLDEVDKQLGPVRMVFVNFRDPSNKIDYEEWEKIYRDLKKQRDDLARQLDALMKPSQDALDVANAFISARMTDLTPDQLDKLREKYVDRKPALNELQISVPDANLVDRCQTCHIGVSLTMTGLELTPVSMSLPNQKPDQYARAFVTHPRPELLRIHDPAKFGCTLCHGGNGRETASVERAHGNYKNWPRPLYPKGYIETGCQTCHMADRVLAGTTELADTLDRAKDMYRQGCVGCHRYPGFEDERDELKSVAAQTRTLEQRKKNNLRQITSKQGQADVALTDEDARRLRQEVRNLNLDNSQIDIQLEQLDQRTRDLLREEKKVGHNFKEIRQKLNPNWLPFFITGSGRATGPTATNYEQARAIAAYLWQAGIQDPIAKQEPGDPARGKELVERRGCLGCHGIAADPTLAVRKPNLPNFSGPIPSTLTIVGEGPIIGNFFTISFSRAGERDKYDYLVRWIQNPRQRIRPYCPLEKKDIGPEDYAKHGLPYQFDLDHDRCPNDGQIMQVQQESGMPNLRLTLEESRDIATYLVSLKQKDPNAFPQDSLDDPKLKEQGKVWVRYYGCAGCHEIAGFEEDDPIAADMTYEGSRRVEQLNFGPVRHMAESGKEPITAHEDQERLPGGPAKEPWYSLKGFVEHELAEPNVYDSSTAKPMEKAHMPNARLAPLQTRALTMFLLGSQKTQLPEEYIYKPSDARGDIQRGWWVIRKYNCMGCHQILPGQQTVVMSVPYYKDHPEQLPPSLITEGARVSPEWLARFLKNPALSDTDTHRNGVRSYLQLRMPTFSFSDNEIRILVRFFKAMSHQPVISIPEPMEPLTAKEIDTARTLMSTACVTCHATGDPAHDKLASAPNFLLAQGRLNPGWVKQWMVDPQAFSPGTAMPSGLFRKENGRWVVNGPMMLSVSKGYDQDQVELLVRYIFQLTPQEESRLSRSWLKQARQRQQVKQTSYRLIGSSLR